MDRASSLFFGIPTPDHAHGWVILMIIVITLTAVQFRYVERKVTY
jgi:hypothetical protein